MPSLLALAHNLWLLAFVAAGLGVFVVEKLTLRWLITINLALELILLGLVLRLNLMAHG